MAINFHNTTNSRRHVIEPIRLSYPTSIKAPITQRGKKGRFADSQAFDQVISAQKSKLVGMKNHLRQTNSLATKDRRQPRVTAGLM
jgi:hypothetical protein